MEERIAAMNRIELKAGRLYGERISANSVVDIEWSEIIRDEMKREFLAEEGNKTLGI